MRTAGIVLCGGASSRMGTPKATLPVGDEVLLQRVVRTLAAAVGPVVVVAAPGQALPDCGVPVVFDACPGRGPLEGISAGLATVSEIADAAFVSAVDAVLLREAFVRRVVERLGDAAVAVPATGGFPHPLAAVYRVEVLPTIRERLANGRLAVKELLARVPTRFLAASDFVDVDPDLASLRTANTPEEFAARLRELKSSIG